MIMHLLLIQRILKEVKKITCHLGKCLIGLTFSLLISVLLILIILRVFMDYWMTNEQMCDVEIIKTNLCRAFKRKELTGNLCKDFCSFNRKRFHFISCVRIHSGKQFVFEANWLDRPVFIKAKRINFSSSFHDNLPLPKNLNNYVQNALQTKGIPWNFYSNVDLINILWNGKREQYSTAMKRSLIALLDQQEYVLSTFFHDFHIFPEVYGSCGQVYAVEKVTPVKSMFLPRIPANFKHRILLALEIVEFLHSVDVLSHGSMYFCDVKFDHLGMNDRQEIRFIDSDTVEFENSLIAMLRYYHRNNSSCEDSCSFFDCIANCNELCFPLSLRNNVQVFIKNIFRRGDEVSGLLQNAPIEYLDEVQYIFNNCTMSDLDRVNNLEMVLSSLKRIDHRYHMKIV